MNHCINQGIMLTWYFLLYHAAFKDGLYRTAHTEEFVRVK